MTNYINQVMIASGDNRLRRQLVTANIQPIQSCDSVIFRLCVQIRHQIEWSIVVLHKILYYFGINTFRQTFDKHSGVSVM